MIPYNTDLEQALKWQQNNATNLKSIIAQKKLWYERNSEQFWENWYSAFYNIDTANDFGLTLWCIILGLNTEQFGFDPIRHAWAYGQKRENYVYSGEPGLPSPNVIGGNFVGGSSGAISNWDEIRRLIKLRYVALVNDGTLSFVNKMLQVIFNDGQPWDFAAGNYFYAVDATTRGKSGNFSPSLVYEQSEFEGKVVLSSISRNQAIADVGWVTNGLTYDPIVADPAFPGSYASIKFTAGAGNGEKFATFNGTAPAGELCFQTIVRPGTASQLVLSCNNSLNAKAWIFVDANFGCILKKGDDVISYGAEKLPSGCTKVWFTYNATSSSPQAKVSMCAGGKMNTPAPQGSYFNLIATTLARGSYYGRYIPRRSATAAVQTDYTLTASTGAIAMGYTPVAGVSLYWEGHARGASTILPIKFGDGNGVANTFTLPSPPNSVDGVSGAFKIEYRLGQNAGVSDQSFALLSDVTSGIIPVPAGVSYTIVKE